MRQLPDAAPAKIDSLTVRLDQLAAANGNEAVGWEDTSSRAMKDAREVLRLGALPATGQGELYVSVADHIGRRQITEDPIRYRDTKVGRIMITLSAGYLSVASATKKLLVTQLNQAMRDLAG